MQRAEEMVRELLVPSARDEQDGLKKQQLRDLAILNGTFKENKADLQPCSNRRVTGSKPPPPPPPPAAKGAVDVRRTEPHAAPAPPR